MSFCRSHLDWNCVQGGQLAGQVPFPVSSQLPPTQHLLPTVSHGVCTEFGHGDLGSLLSSLWFLVSARWPLATKICAWQHQLGSDNKAGLPGKMMVAGNDRSAGEISKCHHHYTLGVSIGTCVGGRAGFQSMPAPYPGKDFVSEFGSDWWGLSLRRNCDCNNHCITWRDVQSQQLQNSQTHCLHGRGWWGLGWDRGSQLQRQQMTAWLAGFCGEDAHA